MVRVRSYGSDTKRWVIDDGEGDNGRIVDSVKTADKVWGCTDGQWFTFHDAYLSFVGNHAIIHHNPTPITKALNETPLQGAEDGS